MTAPPAVRMLLSLLVSGAAGLAALLFLATALMTGGFAGPVPRGENAMGLIVPLLGSGAAAGLLLAAALGCAWRGGLDWTGRRPAWVATLAALGVGGAGFGMLLAWTGQIGPWVPYVGWLAGGVGPLLACVLFLACAWVPAERLQRARWPRLAGVALLPVIAFGFVLAALGAGAAWREERANAARIEAARDAGSAEEARRGALPAVERLREDYAGYSPDAPLWVFTAGLPDIHGAEERDFVIARALQVPEFDADLANNLASDHRRYRHGAIELIRHVPQDRLSPAWQAPLAAAIRRSTEEIGTDPGWFTVDDFAQPDPTQHVRAMFEAAARLGPGAELDEALRGLRHALDALPPERRAAFADLAAPA